MTRLGVARPGKNFCDTLPLPFSAISEKSFNDDLFRNAWMAWQSKHRNSIMKGRLVHLLTKSCYARGGKKIFRAADSAGRHTAWPLRDHARKPTVLEI